MWNLSTRGRGRGGSGGGSRRTANGAGSRGATPRGFSAEAPASVKVDKAIEKYLQIAAEIKEAQPGHVSPHEFVQPSAQDLLQEDVVRSVEVASQAGYSAEAPASAPFEPELLSASAQRWDHEVWSPTMTSEHLQVAKALLQTRERELTESKIQALTRASELSQSKQQIKKMDGRLCDQDQHIGELTGRVNTLEELIQTFASREATLLGIMARLEMPPVSPSEDSFRPAKPLSEAPSPSTFLVAAELEVSQAGEHIEKAEALRSAAAAAESARGTRPSQAAVASSLPQVPGLTASGGSRDILQQYQLTERERAATATPPQQPQAQSAASSRPSSITAPVLGSTVEVSSLMAPRLSASLPSAPPVSIARPGSELPSKSDLIVSGGGSLISPPLSLTAPSSRVLPLPSTLPHVPTRADRRSRSVEHLRMQGPSRHPPHNMLGLTIAGSITAPVSQPGSVSAPMRRNPSLPGSLAAPSGGTMVFAAPVQERYRFPQNGSVAGPSRVLAKSASAAPGSRDTGESYASAGRQSLRAGFQASQASVVTPQPQDRSLEGATAADFASACEAFDRTILKAHDRLEQDIPSIPAGSSLTPRALSTWGLTPSTAGGEILDPHASAVLIEAPGSSYAASSAPNTARSSLDEAGRHRGVSNSLLKQLGFLPSAPSGPLGPGNRGSLNTEATVGFGGSLHCPTVSFSSSDGPGELGKTTRITPPVIRHNFLQAGPPRSPRAVPEKPQESAISTTLLHQLQAQAANLLSEQETRRQRDERQRIAAAQVQAMREAAAVPTAHEKGNRGGAVAHEANSGSARQSASSPSIQEESAHTHKDFLRKHTGDGGHAAAGHHYGESTAHVHEHMGHGGFHGEVGERSVAPPTEGRVESELDSTPAGGFSSPTEPPSSSAANALALATVPRKKSPKRPVSAPRVDCWSDIPMRSSRAASARSNSRGAATSRGGAAARGSGYPPRQAAGRT